MLTKNDLPKDFDWEAYLFLNPDLKKFGLKNEDELKAHWLIYGYKENRKYTTNDIDKSIITSFDCINYRFLNPDLSELSDEQLVNHFINHGIHEKRSSHITALIPNDFDPRLYKLYNKDLSFLSHEEAINHYIEHGKKENRIYFCGINYDQLIKSKLEYTIPTEDGSIILINHDISKTGAPIFLYDLYDYIVDNNIFRNVYILEPFPNKVLPDKPNKLYHYNDIYYIQNILSSVNPALIYSNSINFYLYNIDSFKYWHNKTILHFHEVYKHIEPVLTNITSDISNIKTYVVSEQIKKEFIEQSIFKNISIFPPFISKQKQNQIIRLSNEKLSTFYDNIDLSKVIIGMCGDLSDRKNILLFLKLAAQNSQYHFVWIGGSNLTEAKKHLDPDNKYRIPSNFTWIPNTNNPYQYFNILDYFFLTSKEDPCPIVVLENLLLDKKIIVLKDSIKTQHTAKLLENYIELDGSTEQDIINNFDKLFLNKFSNSTRHNKKYIENFYTEPRLFQNISPKKINFIVASLFLDSNILSPESINCSINTINQFIIRHKENYTFYPIIVLSSDHHDIYGDKITKYVQDSVINIKNGFILRKKNYGYDIGGLIEAIKYLFDVYNNSIDKSTYIAYLHNKNNISWKNILYSIFYTNILEPYDNIISSRFWLDYNKTLDINNTIFNENKDIFKFDNRINESFKYVQGTTFICRLNNLKSLYQNYDLIVKNFTTIDKDDKYWQKIMNDSRIFNQYYIQYSNDPLNAPIDWRSSEIVKKYNIKNYIELYTKYGLKGVPDAQFEHALERYIGYLISHNQNILKV